ncbi:MAG: hypothetical protein ACTSQ8_08035 [Candidatus Helarchaeota archaeon]
MAWKLVKEYVKYKYEEDPNLHSLGYKGRGFYVEVRRLTKDD